MEDITTWDIVCSAILVALIVWAACVGLWGIVAVIVGLWLFVSAAKWYSGVRKMHRRRNPK